MHSESHLNLSCYNKPRRDFTIFSELFQIFSLFSTSMVLCHRIITLLLCLYLTLNHANLIVQGRAVPRLMKNQNQDQRRFGVMGRVLIGSRPPRCERRCRSCGHCEAVQVPIAPFVKHSNSKAAAIASSRGDDISNYKPMCWKCKCGNFIFNP